MIKNEITKKIVEKPKSAPARSNEPKSLEMKRPLRRRKTMNTADGVMKVRMTGNTGSNPGM